MNKLVKLVQKIPYSDLVKLQKDLHTGNLERLINKRIEELRPTKAQHCPVCNSQVHPDTNLTLVFGPASFRQRASFDAPDCLNYFIGQLREKEQEEEEL